MDRELREKGSEQRACQKEREAREGRRQCRSAVLRKTAALQWAGPTPWTVLHPSLAARVVPLIVGGFSMDHGVGPWRAVCRRSTMVATGIRSLARCLGSRGAEEKVLWSFGSAT